MLPLPGPPDPAPGPGCRAPCPADLRNITPAPGPPAMDWAPLVMAGVLVVIGVTLMKVLAAKGWI